MTDFIFRRHFCALLLLLGTICLPLHADAPLQKVSLLLDWYPEAENAGYFYALVHGYYKQAGLDVAIYPIGPNASVEAQVAIGKYDFGLGSSDSVMIARSRGIPLQTVMGSLQHDPTGMMVHDSSSVHTFSDLSGHTVAAQLGVAWLLYVINNYHLKNVNIVPLSTNYAPFLHDPNYIQQVFVTSEPPIMTHKGIKVRTLWVKESGCDAYLALECSDQYLAAHPDAARAFIAATIQGWRGYLADPASTDAEIMRHNPEMDELQLSLSRQAMIDYHLVDGTKEGIGGLDPARLANQYRILRSLNIITTDYDVTKSYSTAYLPAEKFFATPPPAK